MPIVATGFVREIRIHPDPVLREACLDVDPRSDEGRTLARRLVASLSVTTGVGLAAPQIGSALRAFAVRDRSGRHSVFFSPRIVSKSAEESEMAEGCLSIPGRRFLMRRSEKVTFGYVDPQGVRKTATAEGFLARIVQHEMDHLDGVLIVDKGAEVMEEAAAPSPEAAVEGTADVRT